MLTLIPIILSVLLLIPAAAGAHCDTMDGPVVIAAKKALETQDITPVLKWVREEHEPEIRKAFGKALAVRKKGPEAGELADLYFFETLVRVHRAGEGAPYTGLKPAGTPMEPGVAEADEALENGSVDHLAEQLSHLVETGIRERFQHAIQKKTRADKTVSEGREFIEAYVEFVHYVERLHRDATGSASHHAAPEGGEDAHDH